jgi:hypothetical protein
VYIYVSCRTSSSFFSSFFSFLASPAPASAPGAAAAAAEPPLAVAPPEESHHENEAQIGGEMMRGESAQRRRTIRWTRGEAGLCNPASLDRLSVQAIESYIEREKHVK